MIKKNQQHQNQNHQGDDSLKSCKEDKNSVECLHIEMASVDLTNLKRVLFKSGLVTDCEQCKASPLLPRIGLNTLVNDDGSLWLCLKCGHQACGRFCNGHALMHYRETHGGCHALSVNINTQRCEIWCYVCHKWVDPAAKWKLLEAVKFVQEFQTSKKDQSSGSGECAGECRQRRLELEQELQDMQTSKDRLEERCAEVERERVCDREVLMCALSTMQERNAHLENSLKNSDTTIRNQEKEIEELKSKIAQEPVAERLPRYFRSDEAVPAYVSPPEVEFFSPLALRSPSSRPTASESVGVLSTSDFLLYFLFFIVFILWSFKV